MPSIENLWYPNRSGPRTSVTEWEYMRYRQQACSRRLTDIIITTLQFESSESIIRYKMANTGVSSRCYLERTPISEDETAFQQMDLKDTIVRGVGFMIFWHNLSTPIQVIFSILAFNIDLFLTTCLINLGQRTHRVIHRECSSPSSSHRPTLF
jgi:hypothetical protein